MAEPEPSFTWAIIFAPRGRDGLLAANLLRDADIPSVVCHTFGEFEGAIGDHASFAVVTEEALRHADMRRVHAWVLAQQAGPIFPSSSSRSTAAARSTTPQQMSCWRSCTT